MSVSEFFLFSGEKCRSSPKSADGEFLCFVSLFVQRFGEVLQHFKRHVQAVGNEKDIQTPSDAKRYFCFFNTPGSPTFARLVAELQKPVDKGKYKFEDRDPVTDQRSYCGVPIPADAPPRPNSQAVWNGGKWVY